jgi:hypothetical protein
MSSVLDVTKAVVVALILAWVLAACNGATSTVSEPQPTPPSVPGASSTATEGTALEPSAIGPTALLTQVRGQVTISDEGGTTRPAGPMQVLRPGTRVQVPSGARLGLICADDHFVELTAGGEWQLSEAACGEGRELPTGTYQHMLPKAGRILDLEGSREVEAKTKEKEGDYGRIPVILSPRNTSLLELTPELRWVEVDGAIEYVISLSGMTAFEEISVAAEELGCEEHPLTGSNRICSLAWPASEWPLEPGQRYFLAVGARRGVAEDLRLSEKSALRTLAEEAAGEVEAAVSGIEALPLDAVTHDLLLAGLYARQGLYGDAADAYEQALAGQPSPAVYVALGDVYSEMALYRWAFEAYREALQVLSEDEDGPSVRAAAEFGLGRVYYNYADDFAEAAKHFEAAAQMYEEAGAAEWLGRAQKALKEAQKRSP